MRTVQSAAGKKKREKEKQYPSPAIRRGGTCGLEKSRAVSIFGRKPIAMGSGEKYYQGRKKGPTTPCKDKRGKKAGGGGSDSSALSSCENGKKLDPFHQPSRRRKERDGQDRQVEETGKGKKEKTCLKGTARGRTGKNNSRQP